MVSGVETRASAREPGQSSEPRAHPEILVVFGLVALVAVEIVVTYSRVPAAELYHVHRHGLANGASRAVTFLNFPASFAAIATLASSYERRPRRPTAVLALVALVLCALTGVPGVVRESNLDARPVNAGAAAGVLLAALLAAGRPLPWRPRRADWLRAAAAAPLLLVAIPWIAADLGFSLAGTPVLGSIFLTSELRSQPGVPGLHRTVHLGHHHGLDGVLLALCALLALRVPIRRPWLRLASTAWASLLLAYGVANVVNDGWLEQVVKRGWTRTEVPGVLSLTANWTWGAVLVGAAAVLALYSSRTRSSIHSDIGT
jgi:hypothetical protein